MSGPPTIVLIALVVAVLIGGFMLAILLVIDQLRERREIERATKRFLGRRDQR
jgi:hypothetical protein